MFGALRPRHVLHVQAWVVVVMRVEPLAHKASSKESLDPHYLVNMLEESFLLKAKRQIQSADSLSPSGTPSTSPMTYISTRRDVAPSELYIYK